MFSSVFRWKFGRQLRRYSPGLTALVLLHISRVFSYHHSQCGRRNNTRNPKGFAGSMAQKEASPCLQNTLKRRKFCCFCVEGKMGGHALLNLVGNVFFFPWKNMTWTCQGWMKALILWRGKWHDLIPLCPSCTIMFFSSISFSLISPFFCVNFYGMRFQSDAHIAWKYRIPTRFFIINIHW